MGEGFVVADADLSPERRLQGGQGQGLATYRELIRNPYEYNPYALDGEARPRGVRGLFDRAFGMVGCLAASAALFLSLIHI